MIYIGCHLSTTDGYQPLEKKYGRTRMLLAQLLPTGISLRLWRIGCYECENDL